MEYHARKLRSLPREHTPVLCGRCARKLVSQAVALVACDADAVIALLRCIQSADYDSQQWRAELDRLAYAVERSVKT